jgi:hypothetical protein
MPRRIDQLPPDATTLARRIAALEREVRELRASRRMSNATVSGGDTTITGARIQTATSGPRIVLDSVDGSVQVYDADNNLTNYVGGKDRNMLFNQAGFPDGEYVGLLLGNLVLGVGNGLGDIDLSTVGLIGVLGDSSGIVLQSAANADSPDSHFAILKSGNSTAPRGATAAPHIEHDGDVWVTGAVVAAAYPPSGGDAAAATWQTPTWNTGWAGTDTLGTMSGYRTLQCRLDAEDNVWVLGAAGLTSGTASSICTLPDGYWPPSGSRVLLPAYFNKAGSISTGFVQVTEAGVINSSQSLGGTAPAVNTQVFVNGRFPLGNLS